MGLVDQVTTSNKLMDATFSVASEILKGSDVALEMTKQMTNQELISQIQQYSISAAENFAYLASTEDWKKRISEFMNTKRG